MRVPPSPPKIHEFFADTEKAIASLELIYTPETNKLVREINDEYLHWDKVRFRTVPPELISKGLTSKMLWHAVKMARSHGRQELPLSYTRPENKLHYFSPPKHLEWIHHIDKQGGGAIGVSGHSALGDESDRYLFSSLMEEAIASSQLEGASTTRKVAKQMLRENRKPRNEAERMILNNYMAILQVRKLRKDDLTAEMLCELQRVLTADTLDKPDAAGRFRRDDELIHVVDNATNEELHIPPPASELEWRIKQICDFANSISDPFVHPVIKAAVLHFALGYVHPFVDGNGRTARALFYWYMLKRDYWLFEYFPISKVLLRSPAKYGRAYLYTETDGGDVTYFIRYNLQAILTAMRGFYEYVAQEEREGKEAAKLLETFPGLNHRQRSLINAALKNQALSFTFRTHQGKYRVTYPTARSDLQGLVKLGLLREAKQGKSYVFHPVHDLRKLLHLPPAVEKPEKDRIPRPVAVTVKREAELPLPGDEAEDSESKQKTLFD